MAMREHLYSKSNEEHLEDTSYHRVSLAEASAVVLVNHFPDSLEFFVTGLPFAVCGT
jgi:hypothetical protein